MNGFPIALPPPPGCSSEPEWTGIGFEVGGTVHSVLSYETGASGWTEELTSFHEDASGEHHFIDRASREHAVSRLRLWLSSPSSVILEIGCSTGFLLDQLRGDFPAAVVVGADCVRRPLDRFAKDHPDVPLLQFNVLTSPLPDCSVDALVALNVLEHIEDDAGAAGQLWRMLKPGGVAVLEVPAGPGLYDMHDQQLLHYRRYDMKGLLRLLCDAGFEVLERSHLGCFLYPGFWLVKKRNARRLSSANEDERLEIVAQSIRNTGKNPLLKWTMQLEAGLRRWIHYPFGIRCLVVCRRPAQPMSNTH